MAAPSVSIVMPCSNARQHLVRSAGSVLALTFDDWELIAVDDGSTDDTRAWLNTQRDPRIRAHGQSNGGVSAARNAGLERAASTFVAFLDAFDTWEPTFPAEMHAALAARPDAVLAHCGWQKPGLPGGRRAPFLPPDDETLAKEETLFASCSWPIHAAMVRRQAVLNAGGFDPTLKNAEDYSLWLRLAARSPIVRVPKVLAHYHFHGAHQASAAVVRAAMNRLRARERYPSEHPQFAGQPGEVSPAEADAWPLARQGLRTLLEA